VHFLCKIYFECICITYKDMIHYVSM